MRITKSTIKKVFRAKECSIETMELKGYELVDQLFVDSSGLGSDDEPALTVNPFLKRVHELLDIHGELTAKLTGVGQFQVYVGLFKKVNKPAGRIVANNTLEIQKDGKRIIRLYDTDILTYGEGKLILNSGGFNTRTTSQRMNQFLKNGMVYRKDWTLHCEYNGTDYKFGDDDTLTINL